MASPDILLDGLSLATCASNIGQLSAALTVPAVRTPNLVVSGRTGEMWVPNKKYDANTITLPLEIAGAEPDGTHPGPFPSDALFLNRIDALYDIISQRGRLIDVVHNRADGTVRQCQAEVINTVDPATLGRAPFARFPLELHIPGAFWEDPEDLVITVPLGKTWSGTSDVALTALDGSTAPIEDSIIDIYDLPGTAGARTALLNGGLGPSGVGIAIDEFPRGDVVRLDNRTGYYYQNSYVKTLLRRNRSTNPAFGSNTVGYASVGSTGGAPVGFVGGYAPGGVGAWGKIVASGAGDITWRHAPHTTAEFTAAGYVVGNTYTWSTYNRWMDGPGTTHGADLQIRFSTSGGAFISQAANAGIVVARETDPNNPAGWYRQSVTATIPATTGMIDIRSTLYSVANTNSWHTTATLIESGSTLGSYFDGASPDGEWDGAANNSTSSLYAYSQPTTPTLVIDPSRYYRYGNRYLVLDRNASRLHRLLLQSAGTPLNGTAASRIEIRTRRKFVSG